jgi:hypothetical protein
MERRRFVPSTDGLEGRSMMSILHPSMTTAAQLAGQTLQQKTLRIDRVPFYLEQIQPGRFLPAATTDHIKNDLNAIKGHLHDPPSASLNAVNLQLRSTLTHPTLSKDRAQGLLVTFGKALSGAGATPDQVAAFEADLNQLIQVDTVSINPSSLAANDTSLILQTALAIGRPIRQPQRPTLVSTDDTGAKGDYITAVRQPRLTSSYDPQTTVQIIDTSGNVLGQVAVPASGVYTVGFDQPLSLGKHTLQIRAFDANGDFSIPSKSFTLTIVAPRSPKPTATTASVPGGPLALNGSSQ